MIAHGILDNANTTESFKSRSPTHTISRIGSEIWSDIVDGTAIHHPACLTRFRLTTFVDIKNYLYWYWFAFPAVVPTKPGFATQTHEPERIADTWSQENIASLFHNYQQFYTVQTSGIDGKHSHDHDRQQHNDPDPFFIVICDPDSTSTTQSTRILSLAEYDSKQVRESVPESSTVLFAFVDPSQLADYAGWTLRNFLLLLAYRWQLQDISVLCFRDGLHAVHRRSSVMVAFSHAHYTPTSIILRVKLDPTLLPLSDTTSSSPSHAFENGNNSVPILKCMGWERDAKNRIRPRVINLRQFFDPENLVDSTIDLNLRLMRWRIVPDLNLGAVQSNRCLLIGAGTLGCNVARLLLGWGIRHITFVDNGYVSYSNPVRQPLYEFKDSISGKTSKADCAAAAMRRIFPGVKSSAHQFSVPMPGHTVSGSDDARKQALDDIARLNQLIADHDVVYLMTDSRESRWLPSLLCAYQNKLVINCALGFESFVVIRHGQRHDPLAAAEPAVVNTTTTTTTTATTTFADSKSTGQQRLACYFCSDVVAPTDSMTARTLDRQCTVTRPGLAPICSALAVEMLVSLSHHPLRGMAPAPSSSDDPRQTVMGLVPHQVRGSVTNFQSMPFRGMSYSQCTACSDAILAEYSKRGFDFIIDVLNNSNILEDISGITQMKLEAEKYLHEIESAAAAAADDDTGTGTGSHSSDSDSDFDLL
jgi:ubiquitin-like modifier-activating enzyme ATG7